MEANEHGWRVPKGSCDRFEDLESLLSCEIEDLDVPRNLLHYDYTKFVTSVRLGEAKPKFMKDFPYRGNGDTYTVERELWYHDPASKQDPKKCQGQIREWVIVHVHYNNEYDFALQRQGKNQVVTAIQQVNVRNCTMIQTPQVDGEEPKSSNYDALLKGHYIEDHGLQVFGWCEEGWNWEEKANGDQGRLRVQRLVMQDNLDKMRVWFPEMQQFENRTVQSGHMDMDRLLDEGCACLREFGEAINYSCSDDSCEPVSKEPYIGIEILSIGNNDYNIWDETGLKRFVLTSCEDDATNVRDAFQQLLGIPESGCHLEKNVGNRVDLEEMIEQWAKERLAGSNRVRIAFLWWAGHSIALGGKTYLIPTFCKDSTKRCMKDMLKKLSRYFFPVEEVIKTLRMHNETSTLVLCLDSCRDEVDVDAKGEGGSDLKGATNVGIVYSTAYGEIARGESPFAKEFLECLGDEKLKHGQLSHFMHEVTVRTAKQSGQDSLALFPGSTGDIVFIPQKSEPAESSEGPPAALLSEASSLPDLKFFSYIILQPETVLTWHIKHFEKHAKLADGIRDRLRANDEFLKWVHKPIFLAGASESDEKVIRGLVEGGSHSLVLSAKGRGWIPHHDGGIQSKSDLDRLTGAFSKAWPSIIVVCQQYGAERFATSLFRASGSEKAIVVVWFKKDVSNAPFFCDMLENLLRMCHDKMKSSADLKEKLADLRQVREFLEVKDVNEAKKKFGVLSTGQVSAPVRSITEKRDEEMLSPPLVKKLDFDNLPDSKAARKEEGLETDIHPEDLNLLNELFQDIEDSPFKGHRGRISLEGLPLRTQSLAYQLCSCYRYQGAIECVIRIRNVTDFQELQKCKNKKTLVWIDISSTVAECYEGLCDAIEEDPAGGYGIFFVILTNDCTTESARHAKELVDLTDTEFDQCVCKRKTVNELQARSKTQKASPLHKEIRLVGLTSTQLDAIAASNEVLRDLHDQIVKQAFGVVLGVPIAGLFVDDHEVQLRICISHLPVLLNLRNFVFQQQQLEVRSTLSPEMANPIRVGFDQTQFAEIHEEAMFILEELSEHQKSKLKEYQEVGGHLHIMAPAGAGKTFVGLHLMLTELMTPADANLPVLFAARNKAMVVFVAKWIHKRLKANDLQTNPVLERLHLLFSGSDSEHLCSVSLQGSNIEVAETGAAPRYGLIVADEAHHIYKGDSSLGRLVKELTESSLAQGHNEDNPECKCVHDVTGDVKSSHPECQVLESRLILLSDVSQSDGRDQDYHPGLKIRIMRLEEVIRSTQRIVAGASPFQLLDSLNPTYCVNEPGFPLSAHIFHLAAEVTQEQRFQAYASKTLERFKDLGLHNRLAIIVPDTDFKEGMRKQLQKGLSSVLAKIAPNRKFVLKDAPVAAACVDTGSRSDGEEWLVYDTVDAMDGLERLFVLVVGLDKERSALSRQGKKALEVRSRIYRAITRAQMMVCLVNELLPDGWTTWLYGVELENKQDGTEDESARIRNEGLQISGANKHIVRGAKEVAEREEREGKEGSSATVTASQIQAPLQQPHEDTAAESPEVEGEEAKEEEEGEEDGKEEEEDATEEEEGDELEDSEGGLKAEEQQRTMSCVWQSKGDTEANVSVSSGFRPLENQHPSETQALSLGGTQEQHGSDQGGQDDETYSNVSQSDWLEGGGGLSAESKPVSLLESGIEQWESFSSRVVEGTARPVLVEDHPWSDRGSRPDSLNLEGDERLLVRFYWFRDPRGGSKGNRIVVVHLKTLIQWGERESADISSVKKLVAVSVHFRLHKIGDPVKADTAFPILPVSGKLKRAWRDKFLQGGKTDVTWKLGGEGLPQLDKEHAARYKSVRAVLKVAETFLLDSQPPPREIEQDGRKKGVKVLEGWRRPRNQFDVAAKCGAFEKTLLKELDFQMRISNGKGQVEIGTVWPDGTIVGIDEKGHLTQDALAMLGANGYSQLWTERGVVENRLLSLMKHGWVSSARGLRVSKALTQIVVCKLIAFKATHRRLGTQSFSAATREFLTSMGPHDAIAEALENFSKDSPLDMSRADHPLARGHAEMVRCAVQLLMMVHPSLLSGRKPGGNGPMCNRAEVERLLQGDAKLRECNLIYFCGLGPAARVQRVRAADKSGRPGSSAAKSGSTSCSAFEDQRTIAWSTDTYSGY